MFQIASFKIICTDSKFFTFPYCEGVSNKHCLLTFFIFVGFTMYIYCINEMFNFTDVYMTSTVS